MHISLAIIKSYDILPTKWVIVPINSKGGRKCQKITRIASLLARNLLLKICANLIDFLKNILFSPDFLSRHRQSGKNFIRKRILTFPIMICILANILKDAIQTELKQFFQALEESDSLEDKVSKAAFCKARKKLKYSAFLELNRSLVQFFYAHFSLMRWRGFRLLAVDGSTLKLPNVKEITDHFGASKGVPMARLSHLYDVLNKIVVDMVVSPYHVGERKLLAQHRDYFGPNDIVLLDRGYFGFHTFALILSRGAHFCARLKIGATKDVKAFYKSGKAESLVTWRPGKDSEEMCHALGLSTKPIMLRLLRVELENGDVEILVTSLLDRNLFPRTLFKELYHARWAIEESYKRIKCPVKMGTFSGKSVEAIYQDVYAKTFAVNLTAALAHPLQNIVNTRTAERKHPYQINFNQALSHMKNICCRLFGNTNLENLIAAIHRAFLKALEAARPGRNFSRKRKKISSGHVRVTLKEALS